MARLVVVGGGRMGEALLRGLVDSGWAAEDLVVVEPVAVRRDQLADAVPGLVVVEQLAGDSTGVGDSTGAGAVIAVKPQHVAEAVAAAVQAGASRVLSIAAGVQLALLEEAAGPGVAVVRAMPNTPALVGAGAAAIAGGTHASEDDLVWAEDVLGAVGEVVRVPEHLLDAVTGLSGSGPAYVFLVAEALVEAGVLNGLPRDVSSRLAVQTLLGSARLLAESPEGPAELRAAVTSPGGTTASGLHALEAAGVRAAILDAVSAATRRSQDLGGSCATDGPWGRPTSAHSASDASSGGPCLSPCRWHGVPSSPAEKGVLRWHRRTPGHGSSPWPKQPNTCASRR